MALIHVLDEPTINQIAAGEVVERPRAVVKELIENAVDAGATAVTVEIKEGGLSFIRITDNGNGIAREDIALAFLRHATSKIQTAEDLLSVTSLGFRGEALSSIAAVAQVELITKTPMSLNGFRYIIEGGEEKSLEEIGCPGGTTILVRNLFYNTPARRKFLKSAMTEAGYISDLLERLMVSHPDISFKYIVNNQVKLQSSGNNNSKDILYHVYGRDIARELLPLEYSCEGLRIFGFIGKPQVIRGNRNFENYFINGRYIKSTVITKAIEEAYKPYLMQHKYPFTALYFEIDPSVIDVNVHPQKLEIRLKNSEEVFQSTYHAIRDTLAGKEMIPKVTLTEEKKNQRAAGKGQSAGKLYESILPEPFEQKRRKQLEPAKTSMTEMTVLHERPAYHIPAVYVVDNHSVIKPGGSSGESSTIERLDGRMLAENTLAENTLTGNTLMENTLIKNAQTANTLTEKNLTEKTQLENTLAGKIESEPVPLQIPEAAVDSSPVKETVRLPEKEAADETAVNIPDQPRSVVTTAEQLSLFTQEESGTKAAFLSEAARKEHRIIGQLFSTFWLVEYQNALFIIDQHAAHEKVLYEKIMAAATEKTYASQMLYPPIVVSFTLLEQEVLHKYEEALCRIGYEFEHFGGNEYSVRAVPADLYGLSEKNFLLEFIDDLTQDIGNSTPGSASVLERIASLSCKAAVKANHTFSTEEAYALIGQLLTLENPYHCPHGRPVIISMSRHELEKKFKRIL